MFTYHVWFLIENQSGRFYLSLEKSLKIMFTSVILIIYEEKMSCRVLSIGINCPVKTGHFIPCYMSMITQFFFLKFVFICYYYCCNYYKLVELILVKKNSYLLIVQENALKCNWGKFFLPCLLKGWSWLFFIDILSRNVFYSCSDCIFGLQ